ncbi:hypothetical protein Taro_034510 [Colocasia esculenta]|uniref:Uncharacterized protein n=1 Tax=Colocasia esculenta TaxID=4460 RepID=A0A843WFP6_COLES|nr:hypothetical protein [Colocasia esculenta]
MFSPFPRFSRRSVSLDYANRWRGNQAESACHDDRKLCSTRCENSTPGCIRRFSVRHPNSSPGAWSRAADAIAYEHPFAQTGITFRSVVEITYKTPIRNQHSEAPVAPLLPKTIRHHFGVEKPSFQTPKLRFQSTFSPFPRFSRSSVSLNYANRWRSNHTESAGHGDRKLCSTRRENSAPVNELGITFCPGIGIAYVTTIRNRHSETIDRALVSRNFVLGLKFSRGECVLVHRLSYPLGRTQIFVRPTIGTARETPIRNRHFDPVGIRSHSEIFDPAPKFLSGSLVAGCRCNRIRTSIRSNGHNFLLGCRNDHL